MDKGIVGRNLQRLLELFDRLGIALPQVVENAQLVITDPMLGAQSGRLFICGFCLVLLPHAGEHGGFAEQGIGIERFEFQRLLDFLESQVVLSFSVVNAGEGNVDRGQLAVQLGSMFTVFLRLVDPPGICFNPVLGPVRFAESAEPESEAGICLDRLIKQSDRSFQIGRLVPALQVFQPCQVRFVRHCLGLGSG